jgi:PPK2 family polyphosphate:nucleotide phosphotransferase
VKHPFLVTKRVRLADIKPAWDGGMKKESTREETRRLQEKIGAYQAKLYANTGRALLIVFQGMDASGKDGATKSLLEFVSPAGTKVANFKKPSSTDLAHDFLWRVHQAVPAYGEIGVFNRSHYEDVLVVRVMELAPKSAWKLRYEQINRFEQNLTEAGYVIVKFFLHISREEQAERLKERLSERSKNWKFEGADLLMRERWDDFMAAYEDVLTRCSKRHSRWQVIPADKKWVRDYLVARRVVDAMEAMKLDWPEAREDLSQYRVK